MAKKSSRSLSELGTGVNSAAYKRLVGDDDAKILERIRRDFDYDKNNWDPIVAQGDTDIEYATGNTWDSADEALRKGRLILRLDQLSPALNQLVNTVRQNRRAVKVSPQGDGANDQTAELRQNRIRQIEYESHAQEAYTTAFENGATRSYGFVRLVPEYDDEDGGTKTLRIKSIPNPNQCLPDTDGQDPAGKDWKRFVYFVSISRDEFEEKYPNAKVRPFAPEMITSVPAWVQENRIQIAEVWRVVETSRKGKKPLRKVVQYLTNGVELLANPDTGKKETEWKGPYIPFASCLGKVIYKNDTLGVAQRIIQSYIRLARDAAKLYNWIKSTEGEELSTVIKAAVIAYEGQFSQENMNLLERSLYQRVALIQARAQTEKTGEQILPLPMRPPITLNTQAFEMAADSAKRDIMAALGRYSVQDPRLGANRVISGNALEHLDESSDLGTYHLIDHYNYMIEFVGVQLNELLPFFDNTAKEVATRLPDGTVKMVAINTKTARSVDGRPTYHPNDLRMDVGRHTVTISTGPSYDSERQMANDIAQNLIKNNNPAVFMAVAPDALRAMDAGPMVDHIADNLELLQPPAMQAARAAKSGKLDVKQLIAKSAQQEQQLKEAHGIIAKAQQEIATKQADLDNRLQIAQFKAGTDLHTTEMNNETKLAVAELSAKVDRLALFLEERGRLGLREDAHRDRVHAAAEGAVMAAHEAGMAALDHNHAMQQTAAAAALQPAPSPNGGEPAPAQEPTQ